MSIKGNEQVVRMWAVKDFARDQRCAFLYYHKLASQALEGDHLEFGHLVKMYMLCAVEAEEHFVRWALILRLVRKGSSYDQARWAVFDKWSETFAALQELTGVAIIDADGKIDKHRLSKASLMLEGFSLA
jgi:hypothetical protein